MFRLFRTFSRPVCSSLSSLAARPTSLLPASTLKAIKKLPIADALEIHQNLAAKEISFIKEITSLQIELSSTKNELKRAAEVVKDLEIKYLHAKKKLCGRFILETYESRFRKLSIHEHGAKSRLQDWRDHLSTHPKLANKLLTCGKHDWAEKVNKLYEELSSEIHNPSVELNDSTYLLQLKGYFTKETFCLLKVLSFELYKDAVEIRCIGNSKKN